ncbi:MAG: DUF1772 domain-containing protein [Ilumatobacteraceae bacterium]
MRWFEFSTFAVTGFVSCAEFGSYAFVHPVLRRLPQTERVMVEKGLLKTFGRIMPVGMTLCVVLAISSAGRADEARALSWSAAVSFIVALVSTIIVNVPINSATGRWDVNNPPPGWEKTRSRWEFFQGVRSWLLLIGFVLIAAAAANR